VTVGAPVIGIALRRARRARRSARPPAGPLALTLTVSPDGERTSANRSPPSAQLCG
jgi:hypothetical protein